jgi:meiotically up-regulated gene 157 (Mug157) protein
MLHGVLYRQALCVLDDAYANAFQLPGSLPSPHVDDSTSKPGFAGTRLAGMSSSIFERKYEVDSLAAFLKLSNQWYATFGAHDTTPFTQTWLQAVQRVLYTFRQQQQSTAAEDASPQGPAYLFQRTTGQPSDSLEYGRGPPAAYTGMVKTAFRPSDDAAHLPFNIPQNAMAVVELRAVAQLLNGLGQVDTGSEAARLADEIDAGIVKFGVYTHPIAGRVYAYEVDGFGNYHFVDDANVPSLLSLPFLGFTNSSNALATSTRRGVLSSANPWFFNGSVISGVGSQHTGQGRVWPMALIVQAWTSEDDGEITRLLQQLLDSSACTGLLHESVSVNNARDYTRAWFAWTNSFFGSLVLKVAAERPHLILKGAGAHSAGYASGRGHDFNAARLGDRQRRA